MRTAILLFAAITLLLSACAAKRQQAVCEEIRFRLNTLDYSSDQREFIQEELDSCQSRHDSLETVQNKKYQGIYERFAADSAQSPTKTDSVIQPAEVPSAHP